MSVAAYKNICDLQLHNFIKAWYMAALSFTVHTLTLLTLWDKFHDSLRGGGALAWRAGI